MALTDALEAATAKLKEMASTLQAVAAAPVRVDIVMTAASGSDRAEAEAIKRGQRPETLAALRKAIA